MPNFIINTAQSKFEWAQIVDPWLTTDQQRTSAMTHSLDSLEQVNLTHVRMEHAVGTSEETMASMLFPNGRPQQSTNGRPAWVRVHLVNLQLTSARTRTCSYEDW